MRIIESIADFRANMCENSGVDGIIEVKVTKDLYDKIQKEAEIILESKGEPSMIMGINITKEDNRPKKTFTAHVGRFFNDSTIYHTSLAELFGSVVKVTVEPEDVS